MWTHHPWPIIDRRFRRSSNGWSDAPWRRTRAGATRPGWTSPPIWPGAFGHLGSPQDEGTLHERFNEARPLRFFQEFTDDQVFEIIRASLWQEFASGAGIFVEGEIDDSFYVVITGMVRVERGGRVVGALGPGDCFGEMGYFSRAKRTASIIAGTHVSLLKISATVLEQTSKDCQLCFIKVFLRQLIRRLSLTSDFTGSRNGS
jgi:hypothetical protein